MCVLMKFYRLQSSFRHAFQSQKQSRGTIRIPEFATILFVGCRSISKWSESLFYLKPKYEDIVI